MYFQLPYIGLAQLCGLVRCQTSSIFYILQLAVEWCLACPFPQYVDNALKNHCGVEVLRLLVLLTDG